MTTETRRNGINVDQLNTMMEAVKQNRAGFEAGVRRFVLNCHSANTASIGVARSTGFTYLATDERVEGDGVRYEEMTWELRPDSATV